MVTLYVEGGGHKALDSQLRAAFRKLSARAGAEVRSIKVVAGGSREATFDKFKRARSQGTTAFLLVDSEGPVPAAYQQGANEAWTPWRYLREASSDGWVSPANASETECHLMVQCMESWFLACPETLREYFGQDFNARALPGSPTNTEDVAKDQVLQGLKQATRQCRKRYDKGRDSFKILERLDPRAIRAGSGWADRLFKMLP